MSGKIALAIQKTRMAIATRIYSHLVESQIRSHPDYPKLEKMRQNKDADRTKTAALAKKLLKAKLKEEKRTLEDFNLQFKQAKQNNAAYMLLEESEKQAFKSLQPYIETVPIFNWLKEVKGLGIRYYVKLLVNIRDPRRFHHPSALRKYCGTAPGTRKQKGKEAHFVPELKGILLGQIAKNFIMNRSQFRAIYDSKKNFYQMTHSEDLEKTEKKKLNKKKITKDDWTPIRIHNYARKAMMNRFLTELWEASFKVYGQEPPANPYILNDPKHNRMPMLVPVTDEMVAVVTAKI